MARRGGNVRFSANQALVVVALICVVLDLLNIRLRGLPLLSLAVLLLCIAWLIP